MDHNHLEAATNSTNQSFFAERLAVREKFERKNLKKFYKYAGALHVLVFGLQLLGVFISHSMTEEQINLPILAILILLQGWICMYNFVFELRPLFSSIHQRCA